MLKKRNSIELIKNYPLTIEKIGSRDYLVDLDTSFFKERTIWVTGQIEQHMAVNIIQQINILAADSPYAPINMIIMSPGGCVYSGLAIIDAMNYVSCEIITYAVGLVASMGSVILASGTPGKRLAYPHSRIMIHQITSGTRGVLDDMILQTKETMAAEKMIYEILQRTTNLGTYDDVVSACARDYWLSASEAKEKKIVDFVKGTDKLENQDYYSYDSANYSFSNFNLDLVNFKKNLGAIQ